MRVKLVIACALVVAGCSGSRTEAPPASSPELPIAWYQDAARRGDAVYRLDPAASLLTVFVYREGPLAKLGHDHVVASRDLQGFAAWSPDGAIARADIRLTVGTLTVDDPELRARAGFESEPSADDISGTRGNMLKSVDADAYPNILGQVTLLRPPPDARVSIELNWHDLTHTYELPIDLHRSAERIEAYGSFELRQSDFGIEPFSVFGGALSVADKLDVTISLRGTRIETVP